jgi:5-methylcytosine-specific restriction endonuclease McrA
MENLPLPPVPAEVELRDFQFMPLDVARLRRSKAWLVCKRRPELAFYMLNLWTAAWHDTPAGSLEDDDDVLADVAMCPPADWPRVRADVLRGWTKCSDGRLYHNVLCEFVLRAWKKKRSVVGRVNRRLQLLSEEWAALRAEVFRRDDYTCRYCGSRGGRLECDHVMPVSRGGVTALWNLVTACFGCNRSKGNRTVSEWKGARA